MFVQKGMNLQYGGTAEENLNEIDNRRIAVFIRKITQENENEEN